MRMNDEFYFKELKSHNCFDCEILQKLYDERFSERVMKFLKSKEVPTFSQHVNFLKKQNEIENIYGGATLILYSYNYPEQPLGYINFKIIDDPEFIRSIPDEFLENINTFYEWSFYTFNTKYNFPKLGTALCRLGLEYFKKKNNYRNDYMIIGHVEYNNAASIAIHSNLDIYVRNFSNRYPNE